jgi:hypothetical protein
MTPAVMAAMLILGATPLTAIAADPSAEPSAEPSAVSTAEPSADAGGVDVSELVRSEAPHVGLSMGFPGDWRISLPAGERLSAVTTADGGEIMETTAITANGTDAWCNVDVYLSIDASLQEHAIAYANFLAQSAGAESQMVVLDHELPVGPSVRIEIFDPERGRTRSFFIFDGPAADDGTVNRFLLTCAAPADAGPFWVEIAESAEVFEPIAPVESPAVESPAVAESPAA